MTTPTKGKMARGPKAAPKKSPSDGKAKDAKPVTAEIATHGKLKLVVRLVGENPERWEYRKDEKPIAELDTRDLAKSAAARDVKAKILTWVAMPAKDAGPDVHVLSDADFRSEMKDLAQKAHKKRVAIELTEKELDGVKAKLKQQEIELGGVYRQMERLADDERMGQGRLALRDEKKNGAVAKAAMKRPAKKAPAKKRAAKK